MRQSLTALIGGLSLIAWTVPAFAATETITGQVVDLVCYAQSKTNTGLEHRGDRNCAMACVRWEGNPVGIVTSDGKVYQFAPSALTANSNVKIAPHLTHTVTVTGDVFQEAGMMMVKTDTLTMVSAPK